MLALDFGEPIGIFIGASRHELLFLSGPLACLCPTTSRMKEFDCLFAVAEGHAASSPAPSPAPALRPQRATGRERCVALCSDGVSCVTHAHLSNLAASRRTPLPADRQKLHWTVGGTEAVSPLRAPAPEGVRPFLAARGRIEASLAVPGMAALPNGTRTRRDRRLSLPVSTRLLPNQAHGAVRADWPSGTWAGALASCRNFGMQLDLIPKRPPSVVETCGRWVWSKGLD